MVRSTQSGWLFALCLGLALAGCSRLPIELGFWMEPLHYQSARIGESI